MSDIQDFQRKTFSVQAAQVTVQNINELATWCGGQIRHDGEKEGNFSRDYIKVRVAYPMNERQTEAHVGDWIVKRGKNWQVYQDKSFNNTFEPRGSSPSGNQQRHENRGSGKPNKTNWTNPVKNGPSPANMPKKLAEVTPETVEVPVVLAPEAGPESTDIPTGTPVETGDVNDLTNVTADFDGDIPTSPGLPIHTDEAPDQPSLADIAEALTEPQDNGSVYVDTNIAEDLIAAAEAVDIVQEEAPKSITLDELNDMAGDPRSAQEINSEA